jgi:hypothetical protein
MATVTLTARYLDQLKSHGKRYEVFDAIVPGLPIRVAASGRKTFTLRRWPMCFSRGRHWTGDARRIARGESLPRPRPR